MEILRSAVAGTLESIAATSLGEAHDPVAGYIEEGKVGMAIDVQDFDLDMGEWQKESAKWACGIFVIFVAIAAITGNVPLMK